MSARVRTAMALAAALGAAAAVPSLAQDAPAPAGGPDVERGRLIAVGDQNGGDADAPPPCARCHQADGSGDSSGAFPRLSDQAAWYLYDSLMDYAAGLRPNAAMQGVARAMTPEQMEDVAAYYASIEDAPYPAEPEFDVRLVEIGAAISAVGVPDHGVPACQGCHGPAGVGAPPVYPYLAGQFRPYVEQQLLLWKRGERDGDAMNVMEYVARNMTEEQISAVAAYFASLRPNDLTAEITPGDEFFLSPAALPREAAPSDGKASEAEASSAEAPSSGESSQAGGEARPPAE